MKTLPLFIALLCLFLLYCAHPDLVTYEKPISASDERKPISHGTSTGCVPEELEQYHLRCRAIYGRPDYCVTFYKKTDKPDGSSHINILCGQQKGQTK